MNILIIEDEPLVAASLQRMLEELEPASVISGPVGRVADARVWLKEHPTPDLIFSDIQLADGISLDIFSEQRIACPIIFTTAFNEYAIRAFKLNSIDYLLKPVDRQELKAALEKFHFLQAKFTNPSYVEELRLLFTNSGSTKKFKERFAVHAGQHVTIVLVRETESFIKEEIIFLVRQDGSRFITDFRSLDEVEELVDPELFFRANRQHLLQREAIESYRTDDTGKITVKLKSNRNAAVVISKEKASEFRKWIE